MGKTVERKRKKKGRPSLLDLQKRSLRLQQQQQQEQKKRNPNPSPNPYVRFPSTVAGHRRTRRNSIAEPEADDREEEGEEEDEDDGKRREKKLKLVLRIHDHSGNSPRHLGPSASESEGDGLSPRVKRKIDPVGGDGHRSKADRHSSLKATEPLRAEASNPGPTTPLPDKKLLFFILDILQKKDTYGVFSEPVDPEELPDYHEVIENPMDFSTVRKKLSRGAYKNLEQFEKDVFLISSNGMRYNAPDTIYYRQARTIQDHAKKNFENLRQESDKEPETKTVVRRGRPPSKNINRPVGLLPAELTATGFSLDPTLANSCGGTNLSSQNHHLSKKGSEMDKSGSIDVLSKVSYSLRNSDSFGWISNSKVDASEEYSGFARDITTRFGKRAPVLEENRRNTYSQFQPYNYLCEMPILSQFDSEKKQLAAVGFHMEHAYARSLAQFAAHFGSIGWAIAAKKIEKVLPSGMNYGRGWVGDIDASPQQSRSLIHCTSPNQSSQAMSTSCGDIIECNNKPSQKLEPSCSGIAAPACGGRCSDREENNDDQLAILINGAANETELAIQPKSPFQVHSNRGTLSTANGFTSGFRFNLPSQAGNAIMPLRPPMFFGSEPPMIHSRERDMVLRNNSNNTLIQAHSNHIDSEMAKTYNNPLSFGKPVPEHGQDLQWRGASMPAKSEPVPPDLNIRFQSPGSPSSGAMAESQQPDLALQL